MSIKITPQFLAAIKSKFTSAFLSVKFLDEGDYDWQSFINPLTELKKELFKNEDIQKYLIELEVTFYFLGLVEDVRNESEPKNCTIHEHLTAARLDVSIKKFTDFINGLPYKHEFYFPLPFSIPVPEVEISERLKIAQHLVLDAHNPALPNISHLVITAYGYSSSAQVEAQSLLKQFAFLGLTSEAFTHDKWETEADLGEAFYRRDFFDTYENDTVQLPRDLKVFLSKLKLSKDAFTYKGRLKGDGPETIVTLLGGSLPNTHEEGMVKTFQGKIYLLKGLCDAKLKEERTYIEAAIEWGFDGMINENETFGFVQSCIGLEALLGDNEKRGVTEKLADRCAFLLGTTRLERNSINEKFLEIYNLRSKLVHGRAARITGAEQETAAVARLYLRRLVAKEISSLMTQHKIKLPLW